MQIQSISNFSFKGVEAKNEDKSATGSKINDIKVGAYEYFSKQHFYEAQKLSVGREKEDGKYKAASLLAGSGAILASISAFSKSIKSLNLNKKLNKAIKNSASAERVEELKTAALKKQKGSIIALGIGLVFTLGAIGALVKNKFEADKTAGERGFVADRELDKKAVQDKNTVDKALEETKTKEIIEDDAKENKNESNKKPVQ